MTIKKKRGLANASEETKSRVAKAGGSSTHKSRGLQTASNETKARVAKLGGSSRAKDADSMSDAGKLGGKAVMEKYGPEFYSKIGKISGQRKQEEQQKQ